MAALSLSRCIETVEEGFKQLQWPAEPRGLYDPTRYMLQLGGKRLRPALVLMGNALFGGDAGKALRPALAMEVFHNFTLIHDDILDKAPIRRGQPTVHERWDMPTAILSGDVMLVLAYELLLEAEEPYRTPALRLFNSAACRVCEGQHLDMKYEAEAHISEEVYIEMIGLKTAALLAASLELGALLAGASAESCKQIAACAMQLGTAFQIQDDYLDSYGEGRKVGKAIGGDIIAGKKTYLTVKALELADHETYKRLQLLLHNNQLPEDERVGEVLSIYDRLGVRTLTETARNRYFAEGVRMMNAMDADEAAKQELLKVAKELVERSY